MAQQQFYALLVGIDKYLPPVPPLDGCVNDMRAIRDYLKRRIPADRLHLVILENEEATRINIVQKFETHLTRANENDVAFFYYSGHGSQEAAHELFWTSEEDKKSETIVCFDSRMSDGMDLADKELATLLDGVAKKNPHTVVIMDCCNSGSGSRSAALEKHTKVRQVGSPEGTRSLDSYIIPRNVNADKSAFSVSGTNQLLIPEPRHIQLSAAHSFQLAKETYLGGSPRGVFTFSLLEVLENAVGEMSYSDVIRRVQGLVTQRTYDQIPQIYAPPAWYDDLDKVFLSGMSSRKSNYHILSFDRDKGGWIIDAGATHGIVAGDFGAKTTELGIYPQGTSEDVLSDPGRSMGKVSVKSAFPNYSEVRLEGSLNPEREKIYWARIETLPIEPLRVTLGGMDGRGLRLLQDAWGEDAEADDYIKLTTDTFQTEYQIIAHNKQYIIKRSTDADDQPLVKQIEGYSPEHAELAIDQLLHIAKWERLLRLKNPSSQLYSEAVRIQLVHPTEDRILPQQSFGYEFSYYRADGPEGLPSFRLKVVNTSSQKLYISLLYMSSAYEVNPGIIPPGGVWLDPGATAWALDGDVLSGEVKDEVYAYGKREVIETFKLIMSTVEFDPKLYRMQPLDLPSGGERSLGRRRSRNLLFGDKRLAGPSEDWNTNELSILIRRED